MEHRRGNRMPSIERNELDIVAMGDKQVAQRFGTRKRQNGVLPAMADQDPQRLPLGHEGEPFRFRN